MGIRSSKNKSLNSGGKFISYPSSRCVGRGSNPPALIQTYALGSFVEGGYLICLGVGVAWIVAPSTSQVARTFGNRADAVTTAQQVSGCTGWFVPTCTQLQNPGYTCRAYWDSYTSAGYWSNTVHSPVHGKCTNFATGSAFYTNNSCILQVRAFRCVTY